MYRVIDIHATHETIDPLKNIFVVQISNETLSHVIQKNFVRNFEYL